MDYETAYKALVQVLAHQEEEKVKSEQANIENERRQIMIQNSPWIEFDIKKDGQEIIRFKIKTKSSFDNVYLSLAQRQGWNPDHFGLETANHQIIMANDTPETLNLIDKTYINVLSIKLLIFHPIR